MKNSLILGVILLPCLLFGQQFQNTFDSLWEEGNKEALLPLLKSWEEAEPDNPELAIAYFNYYLDQSRSRLLELSSEPGPGDNLEIQDTTTAKSVGFIREAIHYEDSLFHLGVQHIKKGIAKHPRRIDMHFGYIYALREKGLYEKHVEEILKLIDQHHRQSEPWLWANDQVVEDSEAMFRNAIQEYNHALFSLPKPYTAGIEKIAKKMIGYYPNLVEPYSNLGACCAIRDDFSCALEHFKKAHRIAPEDVLVLSNLAYTYLQLGNKDQATVYYLKVMELGSAEEAAFARYQLEQIQKEPRREP